MSASTKTNARRGALTLAAALALAVLALGLGLGRAGLWTAGELPAVAAAGEPHAEGRPAVALVRAGLSLFGRTDRGARLPGALLAMGAALAVALAVAEATGDRRAGGYAGLAYATLPLVAMNARFAGGGGAAQSASALLFAAAMAALWGRSTGAGRALRAGLFLLAAGGTAATFGALSAAPVLLGAAAALGLRWEHEPRAARAMIAPLGVIGLALAWPALRAVAAPVPPALAGASGSFDALVEHIGHACFPWTPLVAFGLVRLMLAPAATPDAPAAHHEGSARLFALATLVAAYGLQSIAPATRDALPFLAAAPLALAAALVLRDVERRAVPYRMLAGGAVLLTVILARDHLAFPRVGYAALGLPDGGPAFPDATTPGLFAWLAHARAGAPREFFAARAPASAYIAVEAVLFAALALPALFQGAGEIARISYRTPWTWLAGLERAARARGEERAKGTLVARVRALPDALLARGRAVIFAVGAGLVVLAALGQRSVALSQPARVGLVVLAALVPLAVAATYGVIALWNAFAHPRVARAFGTRVAWIVPAAVLASLVRTQLYVPALARQFAPRGALAALAAARAPGDRVGAYGAVDPVAVDFYTHSAATRLATPDEAAAFVHAGQPRGFVLIPAGDLPAVNRAFRALDPLGARRNLPVAHADGIGLVLAESDLAPERSRNPLDAVVSSVGPAGADFTPHGAPGAEPARFDDAIEFLGVELPGGAARALGATFEIAYHFRSVRAVGTDPQVFVHVDGPCPRVNGDHVLTYPPHLWLPGDNIRDAQRITLPAYCRPGRYTVFVGFFEGSRRMTVRGGAHDRDNRVVAATIVAR